jgi:hypothetical protein
MYRVVEVVEKQVAKNCGRRFNFRCKIQRRKAKEIASWRRGCSLSVQIGYAAANKQPRPANRAGDRAATAGPLAVSRWPETAGR